MPEDAVPDDAVPQDAVPQNAVPENAVPENAVPQNAMVGDRLTRVRSHWGARRRGLFAYGTLQFPEVLGALLDRVPEHRPAQAPGWRAARLKGLTYPGLARGGGPAPGVLLSGLSAGEWRLLDAYEDAEYDLVRVELADGVPALTYRYTRADLIMGQDWSAPDFASRHLPAFARECRYWRMTQCL